MLRFALSLSLAAASLAAAPATYEIDPAHSNAQFSIRHMMISNVRGSFQKLSGQVVWDAGNPSASKLEATIDVDSVSTLQPKRDAHLRSPDFFDTAKFPTMTFKSKSVQKKGSGLEMTGDLTIHGVTRTVTFAVDGPTPEMKDQMGTRFGASATTRINRKEFGLNYNKALETGGVLVGDEVLITIEAEFVKKK